MRLQTRALIGFGLLTLAVAVVFGARHCLRMMSELRRSSAPVAPPTRQSQSEGLLVTDGGKVAA